MNDKASRGLLSDLDAATEAERFRQIGQLRNYFPGGIDDVKAARPWADVRIYGAKCDGVTNDSLAIQRAIDDVDENGCVFVPGPVTVLGSTINVLKRVHIYIRGKVELVGSSLVAFTVGTSATLRGVTLHVDYVEGIGSGSGQIFLELRNCIFGHFYIGVAHDLESVVKLNEYSSNNLNGNTFVFEDWHYAKYAFYIGGNCTSMAEGTKLLGGGIVMCEYCVRIDNGARAGGILFTGVLHATAGGYGGTYGWYNAMAGGQLGSLILASYLDRSECVFIRTDTYIAPEPGGYADHWTHPYVPGSGDVTVDAAECSGGIRTNLMATGTYNFTLPPALRNMHITFHNSVAQVIRITPASGETIWSIMSGGNTYVDSDGVLGSILELRCDGDGRWKPFLKVGVWTGGP